jgi:hypothetical protein
VVKPEELENLWDTCAGPRATVTERRRAFADAIESHVRAETVAMCKANVVVDVEEEFRNGEFVRATASLDWSAVDAAVKAGSDG